MAVMLIVSYQPGRAEAADGPCDTGFSRGKTDLHEGIVMYEESCKDPLYHAYVVEMDLSTPGYRFFVTPYKQRRRTTSSFAKKYDPLVAVNGGFWCKNWGGFTVSDGELWEKNAEDFDTGPVIGFGTYDATGRLKVEIRPPEETLTAPLPWMRQAVMGNPLVLEEGKKVELEVDHTLFKHRHPRTALGISKDGGTMWIMVVDGRQPGWSRGLRTSQVASLLRSYGAWRAANMDGGSSSTLVVPKLGGLVNDPCYKKADERSVANHLGIMQIKNKDKTGIIGKLLKPLMTFLSSHLRG
jgi:hypothetical protein